MNLPRPEYPRPDLVRNDWLNLNGEWQFAFDDENSGLKEGWQTGHPLPLRIQVPFAFQTPLSTIGAKEIHDVVWYRREFQVPDGWYGRRVKLNFGAVDYEAAVFVNGKFIGVHRGGNTPFSFDITCCLNMENRNELVVRVHDSEHKGQPRGKQFWEPKSTGIWYTRTTGIWQTVWLEPISDVSIERLRIQSWDVSGHVQVDAFLSRPDSSVRASCTASFNNHPVAGAEAGTMLSDNVSTASQCIRLHLQIPSPQLWSPESPNLYDLQITLKRNGSDLETVQSYFGIRSLRIQGGTIYLNGNGLYQRLILDQGYWPQSLLTAPTDEDLKADIIRMKDMGFNGCRKHMKVEDPRFLYWADKLGYLVWGEFSAAWEYSDIAVQNTVAEWQEAILRDRNHPCIVTWTPINESWGIEEKTVAVSPDQISFLSGLYFLTRALDPTRPVNGNDGWQNPQSDLSTIHDYTQEGKRLREHLETYVRTPKLSGVFPPHLGQHLPGHAYRGQPILVTEYGGIGLVRGTQSWGYGNLASSPEELLKRFEETTTAIQSVPECVGYCYTQLSDVEQEENGLYTYDRQPKLDPARVKEINLRRRG